MSSETALYLKFIHFIYELFSVTLFSYMDKRLVRFFFKMQAIFLPYFKSRPVQGLSSEKVTDRDDHLQLKSCIRQP